MRRRYRRNERDDSDLDDLFGALFGLTILGSLGLYFADRALFYEAIAGLVVLVILGVTSWSGWLVWAGILFIMGINHPPVVYDWIPLDRKRKVIGWITISVFVMTFTPVPF